MKKLLLLLFLIPVLSWADCGPETLEKYKGYTMGIDRRPLPAELIEENIKLHCEAHRCAALNQITPECICENLGGVSFDKALFTCGNNQTNTPVDYYSTYERREHLQEKSQALIPPTPTPTPTTTSRISITDAKSQCTDIGFKAGTERFGECVLELMQ
jgi:hypothetical protein